jgi:hypothetical protein
MHYFTECCKQDLVCSVFNNRIKIKCPSRSMRIIETGSAEDRSPSKAAVFTELVMSLHYFEDLIYLHFHLLTYGKHVRLYRYLYALWPCVKI